MATKQYVGTRYQSLKNDGTVNAAGWVYFYEPGTSTEKTTYSDSALSVANASPVVFNSAGAADIWFEGDADASEYDSTGTLIDSYSSINPATSSSTVESNLIANGSFEDGGSTTPSNWTRSTPPALGSSAQDLDSAHGLYSWKFTSGGNGAGNLITTDYFNVAEGRSFNVVWQMKSSAADVRNLVEVVWYDDDDAELSASSIYDNSTTNPTSWTTKSAVATPVSSAVRAKLRLTGCHSSDATAGSTWFDGVQVTEAHISGMSIVAKEGTAVASATDCNIWNLGDGNTVHITGTTTIEDWGTAPRAGAWMRVIFDDALQLTYNATTNDLPGDTDVTTVANDSCIVYARSASSYQIFDYTRSGGTLSLAPDIQTFAADGTWTKPSGYDPSCQVRIQVWGAGGSGGSGGADTQSGGGGGGGSYGEVWKTLSDLSATETVTVGVGGAAVTGAGNGNAGGSSYFGAGAICQGMGGGRGGGQAGAGAGGGGAGAFDVGGNASANTPGTGGTANSVVAPWVGVTGGTGGNPPVAVASGAGYGGGGGGGGCTSGTNTTGAGGYSVWGGGGGGGAAQSTAGCLRGGSVYGGDGGNGAFGASTASSGSIPGGGGGGSENGTSGAGGDGKVIVTVFR